MKGFLFCCIVQLLMVSTFGEHKDEESLCAAQQTCTKCLQTPKCVWCTEVVIKKKKKLKKNYFSNEFSVFFFRFFDQNRVFFLALRGNGRVGQMCHENQVRKRTGSVVPAKCSF